MFTHILAVTRQEQTHLFVGVDGGSRMSDTSSFLCPRCSVEMLCIDEGPGVTAVSAGDCGEEGGGAVLCILRPLASLASSSWLGKASSGRRCDATSGFSALMGVEKSLFAALGAS
jgi:hypothetical protein